jgi:lipopolysaccharide transport system ATP-binding protein
MSDTVISVENLCKSYLVGHRSGERERYTALRDVIAREARNFTRKAVDAFRGRQIVQGDEVEEFWALKDVNFEVKRGEVIGIIGRNGAGKSTLLKLLSRITEPTAGRIRLCGRVASLLEVGTGFHPELTGRENIFLNGAILGMTRREIRGKFDEIVRFAEVEKFLDTPVKHYSSGMYVRLAFAVAAHLEPEIIVVDEVLAVGDTKFQEKCLGKMKDVATQGRTVLFVSHNMAAIQNLCTRSLLLDRGRLQYDGSSGNCVHSYLAGENSLSRREWRRPSIKDPSIKDLAVFGFKRIVAEVVGRQPEHVLRIDCSFTGVPIARAVLVAFDISDSLGATIMQALPVATPFITSSNAARDFRFQIRLPPLVPAEYWVTAWIGSHHTETLDLCRDCVSFEIQESPTPGRTFPHVRDHGFIVPLCEYEMLPK